jgi:hypothetical protein
MPEANSALFISNPPIRRLQIAPALVHKPKFLRYSDTKTTMIYTRLFILHLGSDQRKCMILQTSGLKKGYFLTLERHFQAPNHPSKAIEMARTNLLNHVCIARPRITEEEAEQDA